MMTGLPRLPVLLLAATAGVPAPQLASAGEIYSWNAADGSTWFSEQPPSGEIAGLEVLQFDAPVAPVRVPLPGSTVPAYAEALEMADRLQADRLAREQARLEREALQLQKRQTRLREQQQAQRSAERTMSYVIPYYRKHRPHYPHPRSPYRNHGRDDLPPWSGYDRPPQRGYPVHSPGRLTYRTQQAQRSAAQPSGR